ncbi:MAG: hypothetical protein LBV21_03295, partial [Candidatus Adiutrix sp.]|nr:hypothetical protein [Candidatus Adiutrix sp.]
MNNEPAALNPADQTPGFSAAHCIAQIVDGPKGAGLIFKGRTLHSSDDPWAEAAGWLDRAPRYLSDRAPGLAAVFGLGLGYHLKMLRRLYPDLRLLIYEPAPEMTDLYQARPALGPEDGESPFIFSDPEEFKRAVSREIVYGRDQGLIVVTAESYRDLDPEGCEAFNRYLRQEIMRRAVIDRTREHTGP